MEKNEVSLENMEKLGNIKSEDLKHIIPNALFMTQNTLFVNLMTQNTLF